MTRLDDLVLKIIARKISRGEAEELRTTIESDPEAMELYLALLRTEAALRAGHPPNIAGRVLSRIRSARTERVAVGVIRTVEGMKPFPNTAHPASDIVRNQDRPQPHPGDLRLDVETRSLPASAQVLLPAQFAIEAAEYSRGVRRRWILAISGGVAAVTATCLALLWRADQPPLRPVVGEVFQIDRQLTILRDGRKVSIGRGWPVAVGDSFAVPGNYSQVTLRFFDGSTLAVAPGGSVRLRKGPADGKWWEVTSGSVAVNAATQPVGHPILVDTPQAKVSAYSRSRFRLDVRANSTRLEVESGTVRIDETASGNSLELRDAERAVAGPGEAFIPSRAENLPGETLFAPKRPQPSIHRELFQFESMTEVEQSWLNLGGFPLSVRNGMLEVALSPISLDQYSGGWAERPGGLTSKRAYSAPLRVTATLEASSASEEFNAGIAFRPAPAPKGNFLVLRGMRDGGRCWLMGPSGKEIAQANSVGKWPLREKVTVELSSTNIQIVVGSRAAIETAIDGGNTYYISIQGNGTPHAPADSWVRCDSLEIEEMGSQ